MELCFSNICRLCPINYWLNVIPLFVYCQVLRKNFQFKLVGSETFYIDKKVAEITISAKGMSFEYVLNIDGKSLKKFVECHVKNTRTWLPVIGAVDHRVVLGINEMTIVIYVSRLHICFLVLVFEAH